LLDDIGDSLAVVHPSARLGPGRPYGTPLKCWRLNIPIQAVDKAFSAIPWLPTVFSNWTQQNHLYHYDEYQGFVPRAWLGEYVENVILCKLSAHVHEHTALCTAFDWDAAQACWTVQLNTGLVLRSRRLVLATGNEAPEVPSLPAWAEAVPVIRDPLLQVEQLKDLLDTRSLTIVGLGLTMVDLITYLATHQYAGTVFAVSRSGYLPLAHTTTPPPDEWLLDRQREHEAALAVSGPQQDTVLFWFRHLRNQIRSLKPDEHWQWVIDAFRPYVRQVWNRLSDSERLIFQRRLARYWNIHRHRIPPDVARLLQEWQHCGKLVVSRASTSEAWPRAEALVYCTGPLTDLTRSSNPLLRHGYQAGYLQPDPLRLGWQADTAGRLFSATTPHQQLYTLGPPLRSVWYESTALLEIVEQAIALARLLQKKR
jgi:uncharacterized NAD(P)/FAD-binding protein YdhS